MSGTDLDHARLSNSYLHDAILIGQTRFVQTPNCRIWLGLILPLRTL
ncbi:MAG: hypothetical protein KGI33_01845 [Thaumarchaeota archaeon]|nr:hypothetical protein [Nitrososphaerota archaeon]